MSEFGEAFEFILRNGEVPGYPGLPSLLHLALETLKVGAIGIAISSLLAAPLGVWLGHIHRGSFFAINIGNIGRALPSLAVLAIGDAFFGLGLEGRRACARGARVPRSSPTRISAWSGSIPSSSTRPGAWA